MTHPDKDNQAERAAELPAILFDGHAVYSEITRHLGKSHCIAPDAVSATLDAVVRLIRRAAPPALDAEGLPALKPVALVASEYVGCGIRCAVASWKMPVPPDGTELYTAEQVRQAQREAVAADRQSRISADQWARLEQARLHAEVVKERRLARQDQQPARTSVDTNEFRRLLANVQHEPDCRMEPEDINLIAQINAWGGVTEDHTKQEK